MEKIKDCPFCGCKTEIIQFPEPHIKCTHCHAQRRFKNYIYGVSKIEDLITLWNKRHNPQTVNHR